MGISQRQDQTTGTGSSFSKRYSRKIDQDRRTSKIYLRTHKKQMMTKKPNNWKTTFFGLASLISGVALILKGQTIEGLTAITTGLGLGVAKDHDGQ